MGVRHILNLITSLGNSVSIRRNDDQENRSTDQSEEEEDFYPEVEGESSILTEEDFRLLSEHVPAAYTGFKWSLLYSTDSHGYSLNTLYRKLALWIRPVLIVIRDKRGSRFGVFSNEPFRADSRSSGNYQCFVFRLKNTSLATKTQNESLHQESVNPSGGLADTVSEARRQEDHDSNGASATVSPSSQRSDEECPNPEEELRITDQGNTSEASHEGAVGGILENSVGVEGSSFEDRSGVVAGLDGAQAAHSRAASGEAAEVLPSPFDILEERLKRVSRIEDKELRGREFMASFDLSEDLIWKATDKTGRVLVCGEPDCLLVGMYDGKVALWIDSELLKGGSQESRAFDNERLSPDPSDIWGGDFSILDVEVWGVKDNLLTSD